MSREIPSRVAEMFNQDLQVGTGPIGFALLSMEILHPANVRNVWTAFLDAHRLHRRAPCSQTQMTFCRPRTTGENMLKGTTTLVQQNPSGTFTQTLHEHAVCSDINMSLCPLVTAQGMHS